MRRGASRRIVVIGESQAEVGVALRPIITYENPRLRKKSVKIKRIDAELQRLIDDMIDTMRAAEGIGLAAPQLGVLLRLIVCEYTEENSDEVHQTVLINPEITERQGEWMAEEGCLSIPGYVGTVPRAEFVAVRGKNRFGKDVRIKTDGLLAHILQHEIDHLDGVLYIDYLASPDDLRKVEPGKRRRRRKTDEDDSENGSSGADAEAGADDGDVVSMDATAATRDPELPRISGGSDELAAPGQPCCDICGHV
jgi:peptide deformylase